MSASLVRARLVSARLLASTLVGFRSAVSAAGWDRANSAKVGGPSPTITAPANATVTLGQDTAISGVSETSNDGAASVTFTLQDTNGLLSATGTGVTNSGTTTLTIQGTDAEVNADLATLTDNDSTLANDTINLSAVDSISNSAIPQSIAVTVACYLRGTMIATPAGERAIESLAIGDLVFTAAGASEPIRWIGHRAYNTRFARCNPDVVPVRIAAGALADGVPYRDLHVSPRHALLIDGVLVQASDLANGITIAERMPADEIAYFHIELAEHAVLLANGAPSESFVDDDSRMMFHNGYDYAALYPNAEPRPAVYCAPRISAGPGLDAIRRRVDSRIVTLVVSRAA